MPNITCSECQAVIENQKDAKIRLKRSKSGLVFCSKPCFGAYATRSLATKPKEGARRLSLQEAQWAERFAKLADPHYYDGGRYQREWQKRLGATA